MQPKEEKGLREPKYLKVYQFIRPNAPTRSTTCTLDIPEDVIRRRLGNIPLEVAQQTLNNTTQLASRSAEMPLHRRYKTHFEQLRYRRLKTTIYSDTFTSSVKSTRGNTKTQGFVNGDSYFIYQYPMSCESQAAQGFGIPAHVHTDNAKVETLSEWKKTVQHHQIKQTVTEPYSPWQNKAEHEFGKICTATHLLMDINHVPARLWDYAQAHAVEVSNHTARKALDWKTPLERETGDTPDCSHLLHFDFYQLVWYWDPSETKFPIAKRKLGCWLGVAPNVGQALCYYILTICGNTIARSTVKGMECH